jgi:hypothetical protein
VEELEPVLDTEKKKNLSNFEKDKLAAKRKVPDGSVDPFPLERFMQFISALKIQSRDEGLISFRLLGSQQYVLDEIVEGMAEGITTFVILKNRQAGISTLMLAIDLFWAFENQGLLGVFATHDEGSRDQFRNQIDTFLATLPMKYKVDFETNNRTMLVLKNHSLFRYLVAGTRASSNTLGRSGGTNFAHCTEVAFWGSADNIKSLGQTFSEKYKKRLYIYESTANGFNHYHDMWEIANDSPAQKAIFVGWWRDERNEFSEDHPLYLKYMPEGTSSVVGELERNRMMKVKELYGVDITAGQIAWYRFHLETKCSGDQSAMDQEMPWTAEDAFIATGDSFFSNEALTDAFKFAKQCLCLPFVIKLTDNFQDIRMFQSPVDMASFKIWEKPSEMGTYVIGADPIFGSSPDRDSGVISVFRCYADCVEQVAEFSSQQVSPFQFAWTLAFIAGLFKHVTLVLEMNGPGGPVYQELGQLKQKLAEIAPGEDNDMRNCLLHMKNFLYRRSDSLSGGVLLQWKSSPDIREQMLHKMHLGIESKRMIIKSLLCLEEARHMKIESDGYIGAPPSKHDDRVFGAGLAYWGWDTNVRAKLHSQGMSKARVRQIEATGSIDPVDGLVRKFLNNAKIDVPQS